MKNWLNVLLAAAAVAMVAAAGSPCSIDEPGITKQQAYGRVAEMLKPCFTGAVTAAMVRRMKASQTLEDFRYFFRNFCPRHAEVNACLAEVKRSVSSCHNKKLSVPLMVLNDLLEHLLTSGCELQGERLAYVAHGAFLLLKKKDQVIPLRRCVYKTGSLLKYIHNTDIDLPSESYLKYKELPRFKKCLKYVHDESYKQALLWFMDETISTKKCQHPVEDRLVLCSAVDASHVNVTEVCALESLSVPHLFESLERKAMGCFAPLFGHDLAEGANFTDMTWLQGEYQRMCAEQRDLPTCLLEKASLAEACLPQEEDRQFQLVVQAVEDIIHRGCMEDGAALATIMHEAYRQRAATPDSGHPIRDCYKGVVEGRKNVEEQGVSKNMRFYHDLLAFKQCVVDKLHDNNHVAKDAETMLDDILKKVKCIKPQDSSVVLCQTIHVH